MEGEKLYFREGRMEIMKDKKHLPMYGVGPFYVAVIIAVTAVAVIAGHTAFFENGIIQGLKMPSVVIGVLLIILGAYLWHGAVFRAKVDDGIVNNKLVTTGVYAFVRNPIYSAFMLFCTGALFISGNLFFYPLFFFYWIFMTVLMKCTEEKWLKNLYDREYEEYCRKVNRCISKTEIVAGARDFRMMNRRMTDAVLEMSEYNRFSKGIFQWVGFRTKWLEFDHTERCAGKTKWPMRKLISYSLEGITGFSVAPLSLASIMGVVFCLLSFLMIVFIVIRTLLFKDSVAGWPSMACIIFFVSGIQLFCTGIVGEYLSKTYLETKHRPIYILKESNCTDLSAQQKGAVEYDTAKR